MQSLAQPDSADLATATEKGAGRTAPPRYFERPDQGEQPLSLFEIMVIVLSAHLGVRTLKQRQEDFRRANGLYLFIAGAVYFSLIIMGLIALVSFLAR